MTTALQSLTQKLANRFELNTDENSLIDTLKNTAFKQKDKSYKDNYGNWVTKPSDPITDEQMTTLMIIANQYGLNPWTKEIYAFPDKGGITPIVGVDGWSRIINDNPQYDGIEFEENGESCTCKIYRKDRSRPTSVTEYLSECLRDTDPWNKYPKRMLRHKAMIQCARLAFGFTGIYDQDEAERIVENNKEPINVTPKPNVIEAQAVELPSPEQIEQAKKLVELTGTDVEKVFAHYNVTQLDQLSKQNAEHLIKTLNQRLDQKEEAKQQAINDNLGESIPL